MLSADAGSQVLRLGFIFAAGTRQLRLLPTAGRTPWCCGVDSGAVVSKMVGALVELCSALSFAAMFLAIEWLYRGSSLCDTFATCMKFQTVHC